MTIYNEKWYYSTPYSNAYGSFYIAIGMRTNADGTETDTAIRVDKRVKLVVTGTWYASCTFDSTFTGTSLEGGSGDKYDSGWVSQGTVSYADTIGTGSYSAGFTSYSGDVYSTSFSSVSYTPYKPPQTPDAPTIGTNTRNSDSSNTITWTLPSTAGSAHAKGYDSISIQRSTDGGSFATIVEGLAATATSYTDATTSVDHSYSYKVAGVNGAGTTASAASNTTVNTPAAPTSITLARASSSGTDVLMTLTNTSNAATSLEWQSSTDKSTWSSSTTISGKVTSATLTGFGGTYYFRVRNVNSTGSSSWLVSDSITTITAPNAPTLVSPTAAQVISAASSTITLSWQHNPIDGSAQTGAIVAVSTDSGSTWTETTITGSTSSYALTNSYSVNSTVMWKVKTKGAATTGGSGDGYSQYSTARSFTVYAVPSINITSPAQGATITTMPIGVAFSYSDQSGTQQSASMTITDSNGSTVHSETLGTATSASIQPDEWLPTNGQTYTIAISASSTSSLSATASVAVTIAFVAPVAGTLTITNDSDTGYATLLVGVEEQEEGQAACDHLALYRITADSETLLASSLQAGASVIDSYAPLNTAYTYKLASIAASGSVATTTVTNTITCSYGMLLTGSLQLKGNLDPTQTWGFDTPDSELVNYWGRTDPVAYDSKAITETHEFSAVVLTGDLSTIRAAMRDTHGIGVYRSLTGDVMHVKATIKGDTTVQGTTHTSVSFSMTRIDGDAL